MYPTNLKTYNYIVSAQERLERAKNRAVSYAFTILFRLLFAVTLLLVIFGMALFVFFVFYYFTLPTIRHVLPVHFEYADCSRSGDTCEYPNATVPFTHGKAGAEYPILMAGQKYAMWLRMDFPESQVEQVSMLKHELCTPVSVRPGFSNPLCTSKSDVILSHPRIW